MDLLQQQTDQGAKVQLSSLSPAASLKDPLTDPLVDPLQLKADELGTGDPANPYLPSGGGGGGAPSMPDSPGGPSDLGGFGSSGLLGPVQASLDPAAHSNLFDFGQPVQLAMSSPDLTSSVDSSSSTPLLYKGVDNIAAVKVLQQKLNDDRHQLIVDGDFGPGTEAAVKIFQRDHGLTDDGIVGDQTWAAFDTDVASETGDYGSSSSGVSSSTASSDEQQTSAVTDAAQDLGEVRNMVDLATVLGGVIEALVPSPNQTQKASVSISVKPHPALSLAFSLGLELARKSDRSLTAKVSIGFSAKVEANIWFAKVFASLNLSGYLQAAGDTGKEIMDLFGLVLYSEVESKGGRLGKKAANLIWYEDFDDDVRENMDGEGDEGGEDWVKWSGTAGVGVGANASAGRDVGEAALSAKASADAAASATRVTTYTRDGKETTDSTKLSASGMIQLSMSGKVPDHHGDWSGLIKLTGKYDFIKRALSGDVAINLTRQADMTNFIDSVKTGNFEEILINWITQLSGLIANLIQGNAAIQDKQIGGGRSIAAMVSEMSRVSPAVSIAQSQALGRLQEKFTDLSPTMKQALDMKLAFANGGCTLDINFSRASKLQVKKDIKMASLTVAIENITKLITIPRITIL